MSNRIHDHLGALLTNANAVIKAVREVLERLKEENRSLKTEGAQRLYREKAILKMKREVSLFKESNDRLMLEVESLKNQLKTK